MVSILFFLFVFLGNIGIFATEETFLPFIKIKNSDDASNNKVSSWVKPEDIVSEDVFFNKEVSKVVFLAHPNTCDLAQVYKDNQKKSPVVPIIFPTFDSNKQNWAKNVNFIIKKDNKIVFKKSVALLGNKNTELRKMTNYTFVNFYSTQSNSNSVETKEVTSYFEYDEYNGLTSKDENVKGIFKSKEGYTVSALLTNSNNQSYFLNIPTSQTSSNGIISSLQQDLISRINKLYDYDTYKEYKRYIVNLAQPIDRSVEGGLSKDDWITYKAQILMSLNKKGAFIEKNPYKMVLPNYAAFV